MFEDVCDGTEWEKHRYLGAPSYDGERRLAFQGYADDVDIPNPIGTASGHHKMTFIYTVCINRDPTQRTKLASINLATVVLSKDLKHFTPAVVISGAPGEDEDSSSLGACLRRMQRGVRLRTRGYAEPLLYRGWLYSFVGDAPAVAEVVGCKMSLSSAQNICYMCENACKPLVYKPSSWMGCKCANDRNHDEGCACVFALRTAERDAEHREAEKDKSPSETTASRNALGVNTWQHAFVRVPDGGRSLAQQPGPRDAMHVWLEGVTKSLLSYTFYMMVRKAKWCTGADIRAAAKAFPWPSGEKKINRPSYIPARLFSGKAKVAKEKAPKRTGKSTSKGRAKAKEVIAKRAAARRATQAGTPTAAPTTTPRRPPARPRHPPATRARTRRAYAASPPTSGPAATPILRQANLARPLKTATPPYTAHHMLVFTLFSLEVFRPFIPDNARETHPFWDVWVHQVHILQMLMRPSLSYTDLEELDRLQYRMFSLIEEVPEYKGFWVPKYHFASHAAMDIMRFGPMRLNWCMMYEAKNQPLKRGCKRSNFHNPPMCTARFWAQSTDHEMRKRQKRAPSIIPGPIRMRGTSTSDNLASLEFELSSLQGCLGLEGEPTFSILRSATKHSNQVFPLSYAMVDLTAQQLSALCHIQHIIMVNGDIYLFAHVYTNTMISHDESGVMYTLIEDMKHDLEHSSTEYMILALATSEITPLWHFSHRGRITYVTKW